MGQVIIPGRNNGYPCIEELPELDDIGFDSPPYADFILKTITGINNKYPSVINLPQLAEIRINSKPDQDFIMRCLGKAVNNGYPVIAALNNVNTNVYTKLKFAKTNVVGMYYNSNYISCAYCNGKKVFGIYYTE